MAPCAMDFELELTQIHNWLDAFVTFRPLLEHVYSKASQQTKNIASPRAAPRDRNLIAPRETLKQPRAV